MPRVESFFIFFDQVNVQDPTMLFGKSGGGGEGGGGVGCERSMGWWVMRGGVRRKSYFIPCHRVD